jgi:hypothetical protein
MSGTTVDAATGEAGDINEDAEPSPGVATGPKYLALHVPNFSNTGALPTDGLHSYLCLGADRQWFNDFNEVRDSNGFLVGQDPSRYGDELAHLVTGFCDDDRSPGARATLEAPDPTKATAQTVDETGSGTPVDTGPTIPRGRDPLMQKESALLHLKGGWRDHSDGNRITTTFGDKVEVIRGNYKLLVLGRQDDPTQQVAGWDVSGGLVSTSSDALNYPNDRAHTPSQQALSTQYTWEQDSDGTWGWTLATTTGSYSPGSNTGNGRIVNYTWVDEMFQYWGSPKPTLGIGSRQPEAWDPTNAVPHPLKKIVSKEWGETIVYETHAMRARATSTTAPTLSTTTTSDGDMTTTTTSTGDMASATTSNGTMTLTSASIGNMSTTTTSSANMTSVVNSVGNMASNTGSSGAMSVVVVAGSPPGGVVLGPPSAPGAMNSTTASAGAMNISVTAGAPSSVLSQATASGALSTMTASSGPLSAVLHSDLDMYNETSASGTITSHMLASNRIDNLTWANGSIDSLAMSLSQFNLTLAVLLAEVKAGIHLDIHNQHVDLHVGIHFDVHAGMHLSCGQTEIKLSEVRQHLSQLWSVL